MNKIYGFLSTAAVLASFSSCQDNPEKKGQNPNVVFIIADDLGYNDLGCFGQQIIHTPYIDSLSNQGIRFTQSYSGTTVSAPSRACLMTGLHSGHSPIRGNFEVEPEGQMALPDSIMTVFKMFKNAGYSTGAFGKWGLGAPNSKGAPENQCVDEFFGYNCQRRSHSYYPEHLYHNAEKILLHANDNGQSGIYAPDTIQYETLKFIEEHKDKPFFLFVPCVIPHAELVVPDDSLFKQYANKFEETPFVGCDYGCKSYGYGGYRSQEKPRAAYAAMVSRFDLYVGQIVEKLKQNGIFDNTIIVITSDNGPHWEGGNDPDFFNSNGIYRGYKRDLYEGGIRVPSIIVWKDKIQPHSSDFMFAFWDYLPTFAELAGEPIPACDGISIVPTLLGKKQNGHDYLYFEFQELGGRQCVRKGDWKLIKLDVQNQSQFELYNIADDPEEQYNLVDSNQEIFESLKAILENERTDDPNWEL